MHITHNLTHHPLYSVWRGMKQRCYNRNVPSYKDYGGRGIEICKEWQESAESFITWALLNGWQDGLWLDRINNNGNYFPQNCRFVCPAISGLNRRRPKKIITKKTSLPMGVTYHGNNFRAVISVGGSRIDLGTFKTILEAETAYHQAIKDVNENKSLHLFRTKQKHGHSKTSLYRVWINTQSRCKRLQIPICGEWKNPMLFIKWALSQSWKEGLILTRIDELGNYSPENCKFITRSEGNRKRKRKSLLPKGVRRRGNRCQAYISINKKQVHLGSFDTVEEAETAYKLARQKAIERGEFIHV